jgi:hypothetical protein
MSSKGVTAFTAPATTAADTAADHCRRSPHPVATACCGRSEEQPERDLEAKQAEHHAEQDDQ